MEHTTDVAGMLERMTAKEWDEWRIKDQIEPVGHATHMMSLLTYFVAAYLGGGETETKIEDFLPWIKGQKTSQPQNAKARQLLAAQLGPARQKSPVATS